MSGRIYVLVECACHVYVSDGIEEAVHGPGRCKRCGEVCVPRGPAGDAVTVCKHASPCK